MANEPASNADPGQEGPARAIDQHRSVPRRFQVRLEFAERDVLHGRSYFQRLEVGAPASGSLWLVEYAVVANLGISGMGIALPWQRISSTPLPAQYNHAALELWLGGDPEQPRRIATVEGLIEGGEIPFARPILVAPPDLLAIQIRARNDSGAEQTMAPRAVVQIWEGAGGEDGIPRGVNGPLS